MNKEDKYIFLKEIVKKESAINELLLYTENKFSVRNERTLLLEESYTSAWKQYTKESEQFGVFETLKKYLVQLQFPIQKGISKTDEYIDTTLRGGVKESVSSLLLKQPELVKVEMYCSVFGEVPVITVPNNHDFNSLVCALSSKNEPVELPESMGAAFINGINNWDRIHRLKEDWLKKHPFENWSKHFKEKILPFPSFYKDKIIVLSTKPYSGVGNEKLNISTSDWKSFSLQIRREHECVHLFTLKYYGAMANNMHDEIIADYMGITKVLGQFNKEWLLHFIGLENYPNYRKGARLENYLGKPQLTQEAFNGLKTIMVKVVNSIAEFDAFLGEIKSSKDQLYRVMSLCEIDLITMASSNGVKSLLELYNNKRK
ncbi:hypothetical protein [Polaribacter sp. Q13]|uniref:DUF7005 family protein n=1 Tax=Polaribacter sp. Q13 TaxID=2806551 RepID=UPI00193B5A01|nr:hypothetical protein [Polaribacter sp. Q13]QVY64630.1 hypothetical protein JOP69_12735 [Polaribacter sp. Q13]